MPKNKPKKAKASRKARRGTKKAGIRVVPRERRQLRLKSPEIPLPAQENQSEDETWTLETTETTETSQTSVEKTRMFLRLVVEARFDASVQTLNEQGGTVLNVLKAKARLVRSSKRAMVALGQRQVRMAKVAKPKKPRRREQEKDL